MKPWHSSSLAWFSVAFLFGFDATFGSNVAQLCAKWKSDANQRFLAMGIITEAGGQSRFYVVSSEFEGISVLADKLQVPTQNGANIYPHINLTDAEALDLSRFKASWPQEGVNGKGSFILSFRQDSGFHLGGKFLAIFDKTTTNLFLASLTNPQAQVEKVLTTANYDYRPLGAVFSADNKLSDDARVYASFRYVNRKETDTVDGYLERSRWEENKLSFHFQEHTHPPQVKPSLAIDGGFLFKGHYALIAFSNRERKVYVFQGGVEQPVEVPFANFFNCPGEGWISKSLKVAGVSVPIIGAIFAVFIFMSAKRKKENACAKTASQIGSTSSVSGSSGGSKSRRAPVKSQTSNKKPGTPNKKPGTPK